MDIKARTFKREVYGKTGPNANHPERSSRGNPKIPPVIESRRLLVLDSLEHILTESLYAAYPVPEVPISTMNEFAVVSSDTKSAGDQNPVTFTHFE